MLGKIVLWVSAVAFISYGLTSLFSPEIPSAYSGLQMTNGDAIAEIGAMYGGLQTGFGLFCMLAALKQPYYKSGLVLLTIQLSTATSRHGDR